MNTEKLLDQFSTHLKNAIARALSLAGSLKEPGATPLHLLFGLSEESGSVAEEVLRRLDLTSKNLYATVLKDAEKQKAVAKAERTEIAPTLSVAAKKALERAMLIAYEHGHSYVGTEHLLHGLLREESGEIVTLFAQKKLSREPLLSELETIFHGLSRFPDMTDVAESMEQIQDLLEDNASEEPPEAPLPKARPSKKTNSTLETYAIELTKNTVQKQIDPVIGREKEIERVIHILCRRTKNNPVLIGEPGVGKTAIVEGLAKLISEGKVPAVLKHKKIFALDLPLLVAGTMYRGEFEGRLKQLIEEVTRRPECILFIDEIHNIIGSGGNMGTLDTANILKPALARGQLHCIGATTFDEYQKFITSDPALERRFQTVTIDEPTPEVAFSILQGLAPYYERYHTVTIEESAIQLAIDLSVKYIHDAYLPDKAIDLIDEACAAVRAATPETAASKKKHDLLRTIENLREEKEIAIREERLKDAVSSKEHIERLEKILARDEKKKMPEANPRRAVTVTDIARAASNRLHIPVQRLIQTDLDILSELPGELGKHIFGQNEVIQSLGKTLERSFLRGTNDKRPRASFLFAGPSGVGKTELAKQLAKTLFQDDQALITFSMNEFAEAHSVSKLLGSPAGYIGHKERNRFTDAIKKRPHAVILFDEFDKAHTDVQKLLFQILDEGELTDSSGKHIRFRHAIIVLTTNIGAEEFKAHHFGFSGASEAGMIPERLKRIETKLKDEFGAPLIGRLSSVHIFRPLQKEDVQHIVAHKLEHLAKELGKNALDLVTEPVATEAIARSAWSPETGARHIDATIERLVHDLLLATMKKPNKRKKTLTLTVKKEHLTLL